MLYILRSVHILYPVGGNVRPFPSSNLAGGALLLIVLACLFAMPAQASTITVCPSGCNYSGIQEAINAASPGDTIEISSGEYYETLVVNKSLTLAGIDTGTGYPVVNAGNRDVAVSIDAPGCILGNLAIRGAHHSTVVIRSDNVLLDSLDITQASTGPGMLSDPAVTADNITGVYLYGDGVWRNYRLYRPLRLPRLFYPGQHVQ